MNKLRASITNLEIIQLTKDHSFFKHASGILDDEIKIGLNKLINYELYRAVINDLTDNINLS